MVLLSSADFFSKSTFSKTSFRNTIRVSNSLDPDSVGPDLVPNRLQRLSADCQRKSPLSKEKVKYLMNQSNSVASN